eukprot:scaffold1393_cov343-Prasinococcus_capsulatus_cf.AAC.7
MIVITLLTTCGRAAQGNARPQEGWEGGVRACVRACRRARGGSAGARARPTFSEGDAEVDAAGAAMLLQRADGHAAARAIPGWGGGGGGSGEGRGGGRPQSMPAHRAAAAAAAAAAAPPTRARPCLAWRCAGRRAARR